LGSRGLRGAHAAASGLIAFTVGTRVLIDGVASLAKRIMLRRIEK